jgi:hypothetical protein
MEMATRRTKAVRAENSSTTLASVRIVEETAVNVDSDRITAAVILSVSVVVNVPDVYVSFVGGIGVRLVVVLLSVVVEVTVNPIPPFDSLYSPSIRYRLLVKAV